MPSPNSTAMPGQAGAPARPGGASASAARRVARLRRRDVAHARSGAELYRKWWTPLLWTAPVVVAVVWFALLPFIDTVRLSFTDAKPLGGVVNFVGLDNYADMFTRPDFWNATVNSLLYAVVAVPLLILLPLLLATAVYKKIPFVGFFRSAFYIPAVASMVVVAIAWQFLLRDDGPINTVLMKMHLITEGIPFLTDRWLLMFSAIVVTVWKGLGYYMVLYIAALANVDQSLYEAAEMDGAGTVRRFWHITLPGVRGMMALVGVLSAIGSLRVFTEIFILGGQNGGVGGRNATLPFFIREVGLTADGHLGLGSAVSVFLFVLTLGLILAGQYLASRREEI